MGVAAYLGYAAYIGVAAYMGVAAYIGVADYTGVADYIWFWDVCLTLTLEGCVIRHLGFNLQFTLHVLPLRVLSLRYEVEGVGIGTYRSCWKILNGGCRVNLSGFRVHGVECRFHG
jgi:hypothetical protein